jgi:hypothetical protein
MERQARASEIDGSRELNNKPSSSPNGTSQPKGGQNDTSSEDTKKGEAGAVKRKKSMFQGGGLAALKELSKSYDEKGAHGVKDSFWDIFLHPKSVFRLLWQVCIAISSVMIGVVIPYRVAFFRNDLNSLFVSVLDILFVVEAIYPFFVFIEIDGELIRDKAFIAGQQIRNNLFWDLIGIIFPATMSFFFFNKNVNALELSNSADNMYLISFCLRLVRLRLLYHFALRVNIYNVAWKLFRISLVFMLAVHFSACGWWITINQEYDSLHNPIDGRFSIHNYEFPFDVLDDQGQVSSLCEEACIHHAYVMCAYWAMKTITSIGKKAMF